MPIWPIFISIPPIHPKEYKRVSGGGCSYGNGCAGGASVGGDSGASAGSASQFCYVPKAAVTFEPSLYI